MEIYKTTKFLLTINFNSLKFKKIKVLCKFIYYHTLEKNLNTLDKISLYQKIYYTGQKF